MPFGVASARRTTRLSVLAVVSASLACTDEVRPPTAPSPDLRAAAAADEARPFYYHQGQRIELAEDPTRLVVAARGGAEFAAAEVLQSLGLSVQSRRSLAAAAVGHVELRLATGTSRATALAARTRLRADPRIEFASVGYTHAQGGGLITLVNRVSVEFRPGVSHQQIDSFAQALGLRLESAARPDSARFTYWFHYPARADVDPLAIAAQLDRHPLVTAASPDHLAPFKNFYAPSDQYYAFQYYLTNGTTRNGVGVHINPEPAWDITRGYLSATGGGNVVAVLDDGVQPGHLDLPNVGYGYDASGSGGSGYPGFNQSHGTNVAGIIAAAQDNYYGSGIAGIAPDAQIYPVRLTDENGVYLTGAQIARGIDVAWYYGPAAVLSNSWGGPPSAANNDITNAIGRAVTQGRGGKGAIVVFAAGNDSDRENRYGRGVYEAPVGYPARLSTVIAVGAIDRNGAVSNYSPRGSELDIVAPSSRYVPTQYDPPCTVSDLVTTELKDGQGCNNGPYGSMDHTSTFGGTSAAAPQVAGVAALMVAANPSLSGGQIRSYLLSNADYWGDANLFGAGKVNAGRAVQAARNGGGSSEPPQCEPVPPQLVCQN